MLAHRHLEYRRQMASNRLQRQRQSLSLSELCTAATAKGKEEAPVVNDWCDNQQSLNLAVSRIRHHHQQSSGRGDGEHQQHQQQSGQGHGEQENQQQHEIKVIQTFRHQHIATHADVRLSLNPLWNALVGSTNVSSLSLVGVQLDASASLLLGRALRCPNTCLQQLQVCRLLPDGILALSEALPYNCNLTQLRLTFNHDVSRSLASTLLQAIAQHGINNSNAAAAKRGRRVGDGGLMSLKLYGLDLSPVMSDVALVVRACQGSLTELRLTRCHLNNNNNMDDNMSRLFSLTTAIYETNCLQVLDLSMNQIAFDDYDTTTTTAATATSCTTTMTQLLETPSIQELVLSQNELGKMMATTTTTTNIISKNNNNNTDARAFCHALGRNTTLMTLSLDMNPLTLEFATLLETVSLAQNTTLTRLGILTSSLHTHHHHSSTNAAAAATNDNENKSSSSSTTPDVRQRLRHWIQLNQAGRGWIRNTTKTITATTTKTQQQQQQHEHNCSDDDPTKLFSIVLSRYSQQPEILYSLLQERPDLWITCQQ